MAKINYGSSSNSEQHRQIEEEEDRISYLPDNLLITILCLLPIHSAVVTSALSRRWRHIWTYITHLTFLFPQNSKPFNSAITIVDQVISHLKSPKIHTFHLHLLPLFHTRASEINPRSLVPLIDSICRRNPEIITVNLGGSNSFFQVPNCLFQTQSLVQLELFAKVKSKCFYGNAMFPVNLPRLKKLSLILEDPFIDLVRENGPFLKGCPLLEDLDLTLHFVDDHIVHISNPNLKRFCICVIKSLSLKNCKVVIDAPNLEELNIAGILTAWKFVENPCNLQVVRFRLHRASFHGCSGFMINEPGLIQGISCVRSLVLQEFSIYLLDSIDAPPMFHNLIHLSLSYNATDFFIGRLPGCFLLGKVKRVDILDVSCYDIKKFQIEVIKHILSNATVLEKLYVGVFPEGESTMQREYDFCKKLFMLSKSSVNCHIEFFGTSLITSSENFRDGVLTCQVRDHQHSRIVHIDLR